MFSGRFWEAKRVQHDGKDFLASYWRWWPLLVFTLICSAVWAAVMSLLPPYSSTIRFWLALSFLLPAFFIHFISALLLFRNYETHTKKQAVVVVLIPVINFAAPTLVVTGQFLFRWTKGREDASSPFLLMITGFFLALLFGLVHGLSYYRKWKEAQGLARSS